MKLSLVLLFLSIIFIQFSCSKSADLKNVPAANRVKFSVKNAKYTTSNRQSISTSSSRLSNYFDGLEFGGLVSMEPLPYDNSVSVTYIAAQIIPKFEFQATFFATFDNIHPSSGVHISQSVTKQNDTEGVVIWDGTGYAYGSGYSVYDQMDGFLYDRNPVTMEIYSGGHVYCEVYVN